MTARVAIVFERHRLGDRPCASRVQSLPVGAPLVVDTIFEIAP